MRFMMLIKSDAETEAGSCPPRGARGDGEVQRGAHRGRRHAGGRGIQGELEGLRVHQQKERIVVQEGPLAAPHEVVAGYWLLQVKSREEAVAWAKRVPCLEGEVELREVFELEDFPVDASEAPVAGATSRPTPQCSAAGSHPGTTRFVVLLQADAATEAVPCPSRSSWQRWAPSWKSSRSRARCSAEKG